MGGEGARELRSRLDGEVVLAADPGYDAARRVWNRMIDSRPAAVIRCASESDVQRALAFARSEGLEVAIRGGGHSVAGLSSTEGGVVIHLSGLRRVRVDPSRGVATVGGGAVWAEVDRECQAFGLATTGGVISTTGVGGLTLGGGIGHLMRLLGLTCDTVASYRMVTADSRVVDVDAGHHPDLDWALRGGGGNFGVVTEFTFRLRPIGPRILAGFVVHPLAHGRDVLRAYRDVVATAPDELSVHLLLSKAGGQEVCAFLVCHAGPLERAERDVARLRAVGSPLTDGLRAMDYEALQSGSNPTSLPGMLNYWKSAFLRALDDETIDVLLEQMSRKPSPAGGVPQGGIVVEHLEGAVGRVAPDATAFPHREAPFSLELISVWDDEAETDRHVAWAREASAAIGPWSTGGVYVNYVGPGEPGSTVQAAYGTATLARLSAVKAAWDPDNVFHRNQNVQPGATG